MTELTDFLGKLLCYGDWPPITASGQWTTVEIYTTIAGNALVSLACLFFLMYMVVRGRYVVANYTTTKYIIGLILVLALGTVCITDIMAFWLPVYRLKAFAIGVGGVAALWLACIVAVKGGMSNAAKYQKLYEIEIAAKEQLTTVHSDTVAMLEEQLSFATLRADRFETIMAACKQAAIIADNKLRLIYANGAAQQLLPGAFAEMTGNNDWLGITVTEDAHLIADNALRLSQTNSIVVFPIRIPGKDGYKMQMECLMHLMTLPGIDESCVMIELTDVTDYVVRISELIGAQQKQERRLQEATHYADAATKEIDTFSYAISHDLKAPVRIISAYADMMYTDLKQTEDTEAVKMLEVVNANARQMMAMIESLTSLTRITRKDLVLVNADMESIVKSVIDELRTVQHSKTTIILDTILPATCDSVLLRHVWTHLLSNALKFSLSVAAPQIRIGSELKEHQIVYYIADNGVGFDMKYADKLFGLFQRLHKKTDFDGAGLGLATVQRILLKHGGYIWADSKEHGGAMFYFTLPKST